MIISLNDIIDYIVCPWKLTLSKDKVKDSRQIKFYVIADLIKFYLASSYKSKAPSIGALKAKLGLYWHEYTKDLTIPITSDDLLQIEEEVRHIQFILRPGDNVIAVNYPINYQINDKIVTHSIDAILLRSGKIELFYIDTQNNLSRTRTDIDLNIIASISYRAINNDLKSKPVAVSFYKPISRIYTNVTYNPMYNLIIESVIQAISLGIYYPRPLNNVCKSCSRKTSCKFS